MAVGSSNDFDLVVLGAGTGGYSAAFRAAQLGLKVALVDEDKIGGTCLHRGCIPTKALLESAAFADRVRHAKDYGLVLPRRGGRRLRGDGRPARRGRQADVDRAQDPHRQEQGDLGRRPRPPRRRRARSRSARPARTARPAAAASGSSTPPTSSSPPVRGSSRCPGLTPDGKRIVTSDDVLKMDTLPKDIVIVGAGAVGVEFASMFADVGVKVTLLEYLPQIVPLEDADVSKVVERSFTKRGMTVMTNARFDTASVTADENGICLMVGPEGKDPAELRAELMLVATGRAANIEDIGLETTKVETDRGVIKVNGRMRTKEPHVYAIGDVIGGLWLAHTAAHEGLIAAHTIAGDPDVHEMDYTEPAARDLLPAGDRLDRSDRGAGDGAPATSSRSARSRSRRSPRRSSAASTRASPRSSPTPTRTTRSASTSSGRTPPTSSPRRRSASSSRRRRGRSARATHAHPTLSEVIGEAAMAVDGQSLNF